jgi:anti-sigma regulatory factor (Ser/Thr protein kinase)
MKAGNTTDKRDDLKEINFLDSFSADTSTVREVLGRLAADLRQLACPQAEIDEILLSVDEALTNAIQMTIHQKKDIAASKPHVQREITVRYQITAEQFDATIIDSGGGFDILKSLKIIPDTASPDYHDQVINYVTDIDRKKIKLTINGKEVPFKGIGAGLKIMLAFMDSITIDLIDQKKVVANSVSETTDGTILNIKRRRRY